MKHQGSYPRKYYLYLLIKPVLVGQPVPVNLHKLVSIFHHELESVGCKKGRERDKKLRGNRGDRESGRSQERNSRLL